jgi:hypothetical protein
MEMEELSILLICLLRRLPYEKCNTETGNMEMEEISILLTSVLGGKDCPALPWPHMSMHGPGYPLFLIFPNSPIQEMHMGLAYFPCFLYAHVYINI